MMRSEASGATITSQMAVAKVTFGPKIVNLSVIRLILSKCVFFEKNRLFKIIIWVLRKLTQDKIQILTDHSRCLSSWVYFLKTQMIILKKRFFHKNAYKRISLAPIFEKGLTLKNLDMLTCNPTVFSAPLIRETYHDPFRVFEVQWRKNRRPRVRTRADAHIGRPKRLPLDLDPSLR